jgi:hypothetical protein
LGALLAVLLLFGLATPSIISSLGDQQTPVRIALSVGVLFLLGLFMGMAFPLGMRLAQTCAPQLTPWLWGVNGATSVLASVLAVAIALTFGIAASYWTGAACYLAALGTFVLAGRPK